MSSKQLQEEYIALSQESERLKRDLETAKAAMKTSECIKNLIEYSENNKDPLDKLNSDTSFENAYQKPQGGCIIA